MSEYVERLNELTRDFLNDVGYPDVHMGWSKWLEKAKDYGLTDRAISELKEYLEDNKQLTTPVQFSGNRWWLTKKEIQHVELLKQYFPDVWEAQVKDRMQRLNLGYIDTDWQLKKMMEANSST